MEDAKRLATVLVDPDHPISRDQNHGHRVPVRLSLRVYEAPPQSPVRPREDREASIRPAAV